MSIISSNIKKAVGLLNQDKIIAIPTETVYGLAGNAFSETAIKSIFLLKQRPFFNPLIIHIKSKEYLHQVAKDIPENALKLAAVFWPGPLTMVLNKQANIPDLVTAGKPTVGVRMPDHPVALELLESLNYPLAAPSANPFGCISPTKSIHVADYFKSGLEMVLEGGSCSRGIESTIVGFKDNKTIIYRFGSIAVEEIEAIVGEVFYITKDDTAPEAPGMLTKHYAPKTKTFLTENVSQLLTENQGKKIGLILFDGKLDLKNTSEKIILSKNSNLLEAASNLYEAMHYLDKKNLDIIIAEKMPDVGVGKSINDRLERATK